MSSMVASLSLFRRPVTPALARGLANKRVPAHRVYPQWWSPPPKHEFARPNSWLGAYYSLREGDAAAMRNRERLKDKKAPSRARFILNTLDRHERDRLELAEPWRAPGAYTPGDYVQVNFRGAAGDAPETIVGMVIGIHRRSMGSSIRLLCNPDATPVEYQFQLYSPLLDGIAVRKPSDLRHNHRKLYHLREKVQSLPFPAPIVEGREQRTKKNKRR